MRLCLQAGSKQPKSKWSSHVLWLSSYIPLGISEIGPFFRGNMPVAASALALIRRWMIDYIGCWENITHKINSSVTVPHIQHRAGPHMHSAVTIFLQSSKAGIRGKARVQCQSLALENGIYTMIWIF